MGNDFFRFKQFEVRQDRSAMKVCTDSCLFGALLPVMYHLQPVQVLDIGTGTGLLSLMYAQVDPHAVIEAMELDEAACSQAAENFKASPWSERLKAIHIDFKCFSKEGLTNPGHYDLIFSNPPFYVGDLKSPDAQRNSALHSTDLNFKDLLEGAAGLLKADGVLTVLVPYTRAEAFVQEAGLVGLYLKRHYKVANANGKPFFRSVLLFTSIKGDLEEEVIYIRDANQEYSLKFRELLHPFYLNL